MKDKTTEIVQETKQRQNKVAKTVREGLRKKRFNSRPTGTYVDLGIDYKVINTVQTPVQCYLRYKYYGQSFYIQDLVNSIWEIIFGYDMAEINISEEASKLFIYFFIVYELCPAFKTKGYVSRSYYQISMDTGIELTSDIMSAINELIDGGWIIFDSGKTEQRSNRYLFSTAVYYMMHYMLSKKVEDCIGNIGTTNYPTSPKSELDKIIERNLILNKSKDYVEQ